MVSASTNLFLVIKNQFELRYQQGSCVSSKKKRKQKMSDYYISQDLLVEILKRLPVKSLVNFRCVCKSWYSLITSPNFISLHITHSIQTNKTYPLVTLTSVADNNRRFVLYNDDDSFSEHKELDLPINHPKLEKIHILIDIVGSCNGLVCVSDYKDHFLYVLNPAIKESVTIFSGEATYIAAFGFDSKKNEYKVVRIVYDDEVIESDEMLVQPLVQIYELSSNVWRTISFNKVRYVIDGFNPAAYLNGVPHWFANLREEGRCKNWAIASFDLGDEEFGELMLPDELGNCIDRHLSMSVCGQLLALIEYGPCVHDLETILAGYNKYCSIWVMKEYGVPQSWSKQFTIDLQNNGGFSFVVGFQGNGEVLFGREDELASYNPETQKINSVGVRGAGRYDAVGFYMESLLSPKGLKKMLSTSDSANYQEGASVMPEENNEIERTKKLKARIE